jgi:uncharacterized iron-regulated membrane protein
MPGASDAGPAPVTTGAATGRRRRAREVWLAIHLYAGLVLGGVFVLLGLTGSLLVFYVEIDRVLEPAVASSRGTAPTRSIEEVFRALQSAHPTRTRAWRLELPMDDDDPVTARYYKPAETEHLGFAPLIVRVDPRTLEVGPARFWGDFAMTWIYDLHYALLLDRSGRTIVAIVGIVLFGSLITGLVLWWPASGRWRTALAWKRHAAPARRVYDLHKLGGVGGALLLAILAVTGVMLDEPSWFDPAIDAVSTLHRHPKLRTVRPAGAGRLPVDAAIAVARTRFPIAEPRWVETPADDTGTYRVQMHQAGEPGRRFPKTQVWIDPWTGAVLAVRDARSDGAGDTVLAWLHPLHSGEALGMPGRLLVLASGFLPALLFATGVIRWRQKARARRTTTAPTPRTGGSAPVPANPARRRSRR